MIAELNLVSQGNGVPYEKIKYPDGQVSVKIRTDAMELKTTGTLVAPDSVLIKSRMNSYEDIFYIISATDALRSWGVSTVSLFITCFLTQRSDREFIPGHSFDLWEMCDIIKHQHFHTITVFHPHSDVLPALLKTRLNRVILPEIKPYIQMAIANVELKHSSKVTLISPDAGAYKWVFKMGEKLDRVVVSGNKSRDLFSGAITIDVHGDVKDKVCLILDDYCDGGRTFIKLAEQLKIQGAAHVYLYVSHGLFSNGYDDLQTVIEHVYTTNSISDASVDFITRFKVL